MSMTYDNQQLNGAEKIKIDYTKINTNSTNLYKDLTLLFGKVDIGFASVKEPQFGAVGDGVTNDTPAFESAIASIPSGGVLYIPEGTYALESNFSITGGIRVVGVKGKSILIPTTSNVSNPVLIEVSGTSDVTFFNIKIDGKYLTHAGFDNVVTVYNSTDIVFDSCEFTHTKGIAVIFSTDIKRSGVKDCYFFECGIYNTVSALDADRKQSIAFSSGTKTENTNNFVVGTHFEHCGLDCVSFSLQSNGLIQGNHVYKNYSGSIYISGCNSIRIIGNHVENTLTGGNGIDVANGCLSIIIDSNVCINNGAAGILVSDITNAIISNNNVSNNVQNATTVHRGGITLAATTGEQTSNVTIDGNIVTDYQGTKTQEYGVLLYDDGGTFSDYYITDSNIIEGNSIATISDNAFQKNNDTDSFSLENEEVKDVCNANVYGELTIIRLNDSEFGRIQLRLNQSPIVLYDRSGGIFSTTDTGTETAVYLDGTRIKLKNKYATSRNYRYKLEIY